MVAPLGGRASLLLCIACVPFLVIFVKFGGARLCKQEERPEGGFPSLSGWDTETHHSDLFVDMAGVSQRHIESMHCCIGAVAAPAAPEESLASRHLLLLLGLKRGFLEKSWRAGQPADNLWESASSPR